MRKVVLSMMLSVDGYIEGKDPGYNWHNWNEEMAGYMMGFFKTVDTFIYGRKAYKDMIAYWPTLNDEFAQVMNNTPKLVFSRTLKAASWNATLISENAVEVIKDAKAKQGKDIALFGGAEIANFFIHNKLVDEYRLIINPILLGDGKLLFKVNPVIKDLILKESAPFNCGNVLLIYGHKS